MPPKPQRAAGTYGFLGVLRHPSRILRAPAADAADIDAVRRGEARRVSCFLRGTVDPYPRRLKQGSLVLDGDHAAWTPFWSLRRKPLEVKMEVQSVETRPADQREPNVKKGGKAYGVVQIPTFLVVTCQAASASVDFVVPAADERLVRSFFADAIRP